MNKPDYVIRVVDSPAQIDASKWNELLDQQVSPTPFMRHEYLLAMHTSASAVPATGWTPRWMTLSDLAGHLLAACPLYLKQHSYGEYVFDWSWANAYAEHGLAYYPKALIAVPFTPVPGTRLMAVNSRRRQDLVREVIHWCEQEKISSLHLLFGSPQDLQICSELQMMQRHTVQFHWENSSSGYTSFDDFLSALQREKRKKIRQERRKVEQAGVTFRWSLGQNISANDWDFFYRCYERTYLEHGNPPYLSRNFFTAMSQSMPENWLLFIAERLGRPIATSLIAVSDQTQGGKTAYGRYWGALERVDCLHFEACYYQPLQWCIAHGFQRFEGGAQGEHKMARALLPVKASSAHWLAHPAFAEAVERFLDREGQGVVGYLDELAQHSPLRKSN
jgi:predicted N-acyltransferase